MNNIEAKIFSNGLWRLLERFGANGISLLVSVILARILFPEDYAKIALVTVFISIMNVFVDGGFGNALIQKKDADDLDFSTVFWFNLFISIIIYIILYFLSPFVASFYEIPELKNIMRVLSFIVIIGAIKNVEQAYIARNMLFKKFFFATIIGTVIAAVISIIMAYNGFGVWSLVAQNLINNTIDTLVLWLSVKWHPGLKWSYIRFKNLFNYGYKLLLSSLLNTAYGQLWQMVIGKKYSEADLAYYDRGGILPGAIANNLNEAIDSVLFPAMSNISDDKIRLKTLTRNSIKISCYIIAPMMMGLIFTAEETVEVIFTHKWIEIVPFLRIFAFTSIFYPIHTANLNAIKSMGRSDLFLKLEIIKKVVGITVLLITMNYGPLYMAYGMILTCFTSQIINSYPNRKLLDYSYIHQLMDIMPSIIISLIMGVIVYTLRFIGLNTFTTLIIQILSGIIIYIGISYIFKIDSFIYLYNTLLSLKRKKKYD